MKSIIIYDTNGAIISIGTGDSYYVPSGIPYIETEILGNKIPKKVDTSVSPNVLILEEAKKTDIELASEAVSELTTQLADLQYTLMIGGII